MGWKALKEHFKIDHHVVVEGDKICIGSDYVHNLAEVQLTTGKVIPRQGAFSDFLETKYPALAAADPKVILALLEQPDVFKASIPVLTYDGAEILEKRCEALGWPNTTHDGLMQYENTFSADKAKVIAWAKRSAECAMEMASSRVADIEEELATARERLAARQEVARKLAEQYPDDPSAQA